MRGGYIPEAYQSEGKQRDLRELTRGRLRMIHRRGQLQSSLWHLSAKYNVMVDEVGWRYLEEVNEFLKAQLSQAVQLEAELLLGQLRQIQDHISQMETWISKQAGFHKDVQRLMVLPGFGLVRELERGGRSGRHPPVPFGPAVYQLLPVGSGK